MTHIDPLLRRNRDFPATGVHETVSIVAKFPVYVITCLDPRTDPSAFLGLELGDAMVIRNAGGRVSPDVLKDLAYIGYLSRTAVPLHQVPLCPPRSSQVWLKWCWNRCGYTATPACRPAGR